MKSHEEHKKKRRGNAQGSRQVVFLPEGEKAIVKKGCTVLEAAQLAGAHINNLCGAQGVCGQCKVKIKEGRVEGVSRCLNMLSREEIEEGYVLACQTRVEESLEVEIPPESRLTGEQILTEGEFVSYSEPAPIESPSQEQAKVPLYSPLTIRVHFELPPPDLNDNLCDLDRIYRELRRRWDVPHLDVELSVLRQLGRIVRENGWEITVTLGRTGGGLRILDVQGGDTTKRNFGVAVDVGTTTVVVQLVDLAAGKALTALASHNRQIRYGEDVISRIIYACQKKDGLDALNRVVIENVNELIAQLVQREGITVDDITGVLIAGNTTMTHLLLGLPPCFIRVEPYVPTGCMYPVVKAAETGIRSHPNGLLASVPSVSGYVGGDITAGVLASGMDDSAQLSMLLDIGTNGEIVIGNNDWLVCCSASAGPAFEGGGTKCGMRAVEGAIQSVSISDGEIDYSTIGGSRPVGICGSGLIDTIAALFKNGIIHPDGKFDMTRSHARLQETDKGVEFVLARAEDSQTGKDIVITEYDISNLIKSKGAVFAAASVLVRSVGIEFSDIERIFVAGGFGNYLNIEKAITIGLLPDLPTDRFRFIGNSSLAGARLALLSNQAFEKTREIAKKMTYFELSVNNDFMNEFIAALFLPHTHQERFPTVVRQN
jgi:uncharacterized 2Fe-2S/4Fe-4S cluster protein (DUF4445 family)